MRGQLPAAAQVRRSPEEAAHQRVQRAGEVPPRRWLVVCIGASLECVGQVEVEVQLLVAVLELIVALLLVHALRPEDGMLLQKRHS